MEISIPGLVPILAFTALAAAAVASALGVVVLRSITHSAVSLAMCFLSVAGLYVLLQAEFIFAVQILIYVGAVMVLLLFAIMLTRESQSRRSNASNRQMVLAGGVSVAMLGVMVWVLGTTPWQTGDAALVIDSTRALGEVLFNQYVLPFEVASLVLLVAMIGAIVIARDD